MIKYTARPHAVDRALLRFGIGSEQADSWFSQLLQNAKQIGTEGKRTIYDHKGKRIIVEGTEVVTVYCVADLPFGGKISQMVERELKKIKKAHDKRCKELRIQIAEVTIEHATLMLNFLKAKSPSVKRKIQTKLDGVSEILAELNLEYKRERDSYRALKMQSQGYLVSGEDIG